MGSGKQGTPGRRRKVTRRDARRVSGDRVRLVLPVSDATVQYLHVRLPEKLQDIKHPGSKSIALVVVEDHSRGIVDARVAEQFLGVGGEEGKPLTVRLKVIRGRSRQVDGSREVPLLVFLRSPYIQQSHGDASGAE